MDQAQSPTTSSSAVTNGIAVDVLCRFEPQQSDPAAGLWFFVYQITIRNESEVRCVCVGEEGEGQPRKEQQLMLMLPSKY